MLGLRQCWSTLFQGFSRAYLIVPVLSLSISFYQTAKLLDINGSKANYSLKIDTKRITGTYTCYYKLGHHCRRWPTTSHRRGKQVTMSPSATDLSDVGRLCDRSGIAGVLEVITKSWLWTCAICIFVMFLQSWFAHSRWHLSWCSFTRQGSLVRVFGVDFETFQCVIECIPEVLLLSTSFALVLCQFTLKALK